MNHYLLHQNDMAIPLKVFVSFKVITTFFNVTIVIFFKTLIE